MSEARRTEGPDLVQGLPVAALNEGAFVLGHVKGEPVLISRRGQEFFAIGAVCSHSGASLADGLIVGDTVRCPWHHACFDLRTGEALRAPALDPVSCWRVEERGDWVYVQENAIKAVTPPLPGRALPSSVTILGGGAAGDAATETLRREGYAGPITMFSADDSIPYDRPSLSKGLLAGTTTVNSLPLRSRSFYEQHSIDLKLRARAIELDVKKRQIRFADGLVHGYEALLIATGMEPVRLSIPGAHLPHVHYLRSLSDGRAIVAGLLRATRAVVIGSGFIGLEAAAALRSCGIEVHIVSPDTRPMARILGADIADVVRSLHEKHGVVFHLGTTPVSIANQSVALSSGTSLLADIIIVGIGVRPLTQLAELAGLSVDNGILVDRHLETSAKGVFAAGDIARWPYPLTGDRIRVEHWVMAQRHGQTAARNILGMQEPLDAVPYFWSDHYDSTLSYVGHADRWDTYRVEGDAKANDCTVSYYQGGRKAAVLTIGRDLESLRAERSLEELLPR